MAWTLRLLLWITTAIAVTASTFGQRYAFSQLNPEYESQGTRVFANHERVNVRSAEDMYTELRHTGDIYPSDQIKRFYNGSSKILNSGPKLFSGARRKGGSNSQITFPGPTSRRDTNGDIPEECRKYGVCEDVPDYPQETMDKIIAELGDKVNFLAMDKNSDTPEIAQRVGGDFSNIALCAFEKQNIVYPKGAVDKNGSLRYIVNNPTNPVQGFRVETCKNPDGPCESIACFQSGYEGRCRQRYIDRTALVLVDKNSKQTEFAEVAFPSCCSCMASSN